MVAAARARPRSTPRRRFRLPRLLVVGFVLSVLALAVSSIVSTTGEGPDARLAWLDEVRPHVEASTRVGAGLGSLRDDAASLGRDGLRRRVERLERDANALADRVRREEAPPEMDEDRGLLLAVMVTRSESVARLADALTGALGSGPESDVIDAIETVGADLVVADHTYELFRRRLPDDLRDAAPPSQWVDDPTEWSRAEVAAFVTTLRSSRSLAPVHDVSLVTVVTEPRPVSVEDGKPVLPAVRELRVTAVVANVGNEVERRVTVEVVVTSAGGMDTARDFVDLEPGQREAITLRLRPVPTGDLEVSVQAGPVDGDANTDDNVQVHRFVMR